MVASQRDDQVRSQIPRKVTSPRQGPMNVSGSARRRLLAQVNMSNVAEVRHLEFGNRSRRLPVAEPRVRRAANEKECRALMVSRLRHNSTSKPQPRQHGGAPASADHGQAQGQPEGGKQKATKTNTPAEAVIILAQ